MSCVVHKHSNNNTGTGTGIGNTWQGGRQAQVCCQGKQGLMARLPCGLLCGAGLVPYGVTRR